MNLPSYLQTTIIAQRLSIGGEGEIILNMSVILIINPLTGLLLVLFVFLFQNALFIFSLV